MKKIKKSNYRVELTPKNLGNFGWAHISDYALYKDPEKLELAYKERCKEIADKINELNIFGIDDARVVCDTEEVCEFCERTWEVSTDNEDINFPKGTPYCCEKAMKEFKNEL